MFDIHLESLSLIGTVQPMLISISQSSHVTVHPAVKWVSANKDRNGIVCDTPGSV